MRENVLCYRNSLNFWSHFGCSSEEPLRIVVESNAWFFSKADKDGLRKRIFARNILIFLNGKTHPCRETRTHIEVDHKKENESSRDVGEHGFQFLSACPVSRQTLLAAWRAKSSENPKVSLDVINTFVRLHFVGLTRVTSWSVACLSSALPGGQGWRTHMAIWCAQAEVPAKMGVSCGQGGQKGSHWTKFPSKEMQWDHEWPHLRDMLPQFHAQHILKGAHFWPRTVEFHQNGSPSFISVISKWKQEWLTSELLASGYQSKSRSKCHFPVKLRTLHVLQWDGGFGLPLVLKSGSCFSWFHCWNSIKLNV